MRSCLWARVCANSESMPIGPRTLCNACGLVYAKMVRLVNKIAFLFSFLFFFEIIIIIINIRCLDQEKV